MTGLPCNEVSLVDTEWDIGVGWMTGLPCNEVSLVDTEWDIG